MIYLDNSATSDKKPSSVRKAVLKALNNSVNVGRNSSKSSFYLGREIYKVREKISDLISVDSPQNIVFTSNATMSLNFALKGIIKENSNIITTFFEHNSVLRQIFSDNKISCSFLPVDNNYKTDIEKIPELITKNTQAVVINCASNVTGVTLDYKRVYEICKSFKTPVIFDFSQYIGNKTVDLSGMENVCAAFSGHKALLGPQGMGVLYIADGMNLKTVMEGGTGSLSEQLIQPDYPPDRFESGTLNTPGILGLGAGVDFVLKHKNEISQHKLELCKMLYEDIKNIDNICVYHNGNFSESVPLISLNIGENHSEHTAFLLSSEYDISVRGGLHCAPFAHKIIGTSDTGAVRLSPGYKTTKREIKKAVDAIYKLSKI